MTKQCIASFAALTALLNTSYLALSTRCIRSGRSHRRNYTCTFLSRCCKFADKMSSPLRTHSRRGRCACLFHQSKEIHGNCDQQQNKNLDIEGSIFRVMCWPLRFWV